LTKQHDLAPKAMEAAFPADQTTTIEGVAQAQDAERDFVIWRRKGNKLIIAPVSRI